MQLFHLIINAQCVLTSFSPVEVIERIMQECKGKGEQPIDVYTTEAR